MSYTENLEEKLIIGIELRTVNEKDRAEIEIPEHWERFHKENILEKIPNKKNSAVIALYTNYEKDFKKPYSLILGCEVTTLDEIPKGFVGKKIPPATYAVYECKGKLPDCVIKKWHEIWTQPLKRTYKADFEYYPENLDPKKHHDIRIYIGVQK